MHKLDINHVYSQAYHLYKTGFKYYFDKADIEMIAENNQEYQITTVEEDFLLQYFEPVSLSEAEFFLTATQILDRLYMFAEIHVNNGSNISIGKYLKKHNFQRKKIAGIYKWAVKPKKGMDVSKYK